MQDRAEDVLCRNYDNINGPSSMMYAMDWLTPSFSGDFSKDPTDCSVDVSRRSQGQPSATYGEWFLLFDTVFARIGTCLLHSLLPLANLIYLCLIIREKGRGRLRAVNLERKREQVGPLK